MKTSLIKSTSEHELSAMRLALELVEQELRKERQAHYALLAGHQAAIRSKERHIAQLERRLQLIRNTRWWRWRRWWITTISTFWWIEDHRD